MIKLRAAFAVLIVLATSAPRSHAVDPDDSGMNTLRLELAATVAKHDLTVSDEALREALRLARRPSPAAHEVHALNLLHDTMANLVKAAAGQSIERGLAEARLKDLRRSVEYFREAAAREPWDEGLKSELKHAKLEVPAFDKAVADAVAYEQRVERRLAALRARRTYARALRSQTETPAERLRLERESDRLIEVAISFGDVLRFDGDVGAADVARQAEREFKLPVGTGGETVEQRLDRVEKILRFKFHGNDRVIDRFMFSLRARATADIAPRRPMFIVLEGMSDTGKSRFAEIVNQALYPNSGEPKRLYMSKHDNEGRRAKVERWLALPNELLELDQFHQMDAAGLESIRPLWLVPRANARVDYRFAIVIAKSQFFGNRPVLREFVPVEEIDQKITVTRNLKLVGPNLYDQELLKRTLTGLGFGEVVDAAAEFLVLGRVTEEMATAIVAGTLVERGQILRDQYGISTDFYHARSAIAAASYRVDQGGLYYERKALISISPIDTAMRTGRLVRGDRVAVDFEPSSPGAVDGRLIFTRHRPADRDFPESERFATFEIKADRRERPLRTQLTLDYVPNCQDKMMDEDGQFRLFE